MTRRPRWGGRRVAGAVRAASLPPADPDRTRRWRRPRICRRADAPGGPATQTRCVDNGTIRGSSRRVGGASCPSSIQRRQRQRLRLQRVRADRQTAAPTAPCTRSRSRARAARTFRDLSCNAGAITRTSARFATAISAAALNGGTVLRLAFASLVRRAPAPEYPDLYVFISSRERGLEPP